MTLVQTVLKDIKNPLRNLIWVKISNRFYLQHTHKRNLQPCVFMYHVYVSQHCLCSNKAYLGDKSALFHAHALLCGCPTEGRPYSMLCCSRPTSALGLFKRELEPQQMLFDKRYINSICPILFLGDSMIQCKVRCCKTRKIDFKECYSGLLLW